MSRSSRQKEKYGNSSEFSQDNCNEGTAARTRPFSFDEIMLRRKNKNQSGDVKEVRRGAGKIIDRVESDTNRHSDSVTGSVMHAPENLVKVSSRKSEDIVEKVSDRVESDRYRHSDSVLGGVKHAPEDLVRVSSWKIEKNSSIKEGKLVKGRDKEIRDSESKSKATLSKNISGDKAKGGKIVGRVHGKRKSDDWSSDDSEHESEKMNSRDFVVKGRYADRSRGKYEKESKRKCRNEDDERTRDRNDGKKYDSWKWHDSEFSERKEKKESAQFRHEDSRMKRRRSRSREHDKDRGRRSVSLSPRAHKSTSYDVRQHGELSSHSSKDRSGRSQLDVDSKRIPSNGLSSHYRRHGGSASGLGGYSPRKRRTEAGAKTPPPTTRSPEKRSATWDLVPAGTESNFPASVLSNLQSSNQTVSSNTHELSGMVPVTSNTMKPIVGAVSNAPSSKMTTTLDSIQLTQASRHMRRLYVENVPASASEEEVMECLNNFFLSSAVNHNQGTQPCISCIIQKKGQALVELLTPEDASAALSFDGRSFSGSILKIRRPEDFVEVTTGVPEKSVDAVGSVSNIVKDSPHKIFIGGISKFISSEMLVEIAGAFGSLKAYRFEVAADGNEPCAFLEYVDQSVTHKACAGLNGMRLGGQVLTVVQAISDASSVENIGNPPSYGIPEHAKPLLEKPTQVLKIKNVLDPKGLSSLSELELEEILEDIRLECSRFGTVKSVNVVKCRDCSVTPETFEVINNSGSSMDGQDLKCDDMMKRAEISGEDMDHDSGNVGRSEPSSTAKEPEEVSKAARGNSNCDEKLGGSESSTCAREPEEVSKTAEGNSICGDKLADNLVKDEIFELALVDGDVSVKNPTCQDNLTAILCELPNQMNSLIDQSECYDYKAADIIQTGDLEMEKKSSVKEELKSEEDNGKLEEDSVKLVYSGRTELDALEKGQDKEQVPDQEDIFEHGCVLVEYRRAENSYMAAHCLHGRLYDDRIVTVRYVAHELYQARFPK